MIRNFKSISKGNIFPKALLYHTEVPTIVISLFLTNLTDNDVLISVKKNDIYLIKNLRLNKNSTLVPFDSETKLILNPDEKIYIETTDSVDAVLSLVELDEI